MNDFNIFKNSVNSPEIIKTIFSNEQQGSITNNKTIELEKAKSHILDLDGLNRLSKGTPKQSSNWIPKCK